jgi:hypothetical protein
VTAFPYDYASGKIVRIPTRQELRAIMITRPSVLITTIVCGTLVLLAFVGALVFLTFNGRGTEALTVAVVAPIVGMLVSVSQRVQRIERHTSPDGGGTDGRSGP